MENQVKFMSTKMIFLTILQCNSSRNMIYLLVLSIYLKRILHKTLNKYAKPISANNKSSYYIFRLLYLYNFLKLIFFLRMVINNPLNNSKAFPAAIDHNYKKYKIIKFRINNMRNNSTSSTKTINTISRNKYIIIK
jgi:hypothetical protein